MKKWLLLGGVVVLLGGAGSDTLTGNGGNILVGGGGSDTLTDAYTGSAATVEQDPPVVRDQRPQPPRLLDGRWRGLITAADHAD